MEAKSEQLLAESAAAIQGFFLQKINNFKKISKFLLKFRINKYKAC